MAPHVPFVGRLKRCSVSSDSAKTRRGHQRIYASQQLRVQYALVSRRPTTVQTRDPNIIELLYHARGVSPIVENTYLWVFSYVNRTFARAWVPSRCDQIPSGPGALRDAAGSMSMQKCPDGMRRAS